MTITSPRRVALAAALLAGVFVVVNVQGVDENVREAGVPYVRLYDHPTSRLEVLLNQGDGQAFAALAQDPLLRRPEVFRGGRTEAAYRAQRPLLGWLAWALSGGRAGLVPPGLLALSVAGFVGLGAVLAWVIGRTGASPAWALGALAVPGALVTLDWSGPECLGTAAAVLGVAWWQDERRRPAVLALVVAGLCRESLLLVPVALAAHALVIERERLRSVSVLGAPLLTYAAWIGVIRLLLGAFPWGAGTGRLAMPLAGIVDAVPGWGFTDIVIAALLLALGAGALVVGRRTPEGWIAGGLTVASLAFGPDVWARSEDFSRVLLPIAAFGIVVLAPRLRVAPDRGRSARAIRLSS